MERNPRWSRRPGGHRQDAVGHRGRRAQPRRRQARPLSFAFKPPAARVARPTSSPTSRRRRPAGTAMAARCPEPTAVGRVSPYAPCTSRCSTSQTCPSAINAATTATGSAELPDAAVTALLEELEAGESAQRRSPTARLRRADPGRSTGRCCARTTSTSSTSPCGTACRGAAGASSATFSTSASTMHRL